MQSAERSSATAVLKGAKPPDVHAMAAGWWRIALVINLAAMYDAGGIIFQETRVNTLPLSALCDDNEKPASTVLIASPPLH